MTTAFRRQQGYDHRFRELVRRTGELRLATGCGVPRSTARRWLGASSGAVGLNGADRAEAELRQEILTLQRRVTKLAALLRLALVLRLCGGLTLTDQRLPGRSRQGATFARGRGRPPVHPAARDPAVSASVAKPVLRLPPPAARICARRSAVVPALVTHRLTRSEVHAIEEMVTSPAYRHVPTRTLAVLAQRLGSVCASPSSWYRLVRT